MGSADLCAIARALVGEESLAAFLSLQLPPDHGDEVLPDADC